MGMIHRAIGMGAAATAATSRLNNLSGRLGAIQGVLGGSNSLGRRIGIGAAFFGAGLGAAAFIQNAANMKRAYYGQQRYDSFYGSGAETLSTMAFGLGSWFGFNALTSRDPVSRSINSLKFYFGGDRKRMKDLAGTPVRIRNKIRFTPRMGIPQFAALASIATGGSLLTTNPIVAGATAGAVVLGTIGIGLTKGADLARRYGITYPGTFGGFAASSFIAGGAFAIGTKMADREPTPAAEGTITSFDQGNDNLIQRMNFSTAGLTLALHNMNRRM